MNNIERAARAIQPYEPRNGTPRDVAIDLAAAGLLAPDLLDLNFDEDGIWNECEEDPEIFVITEGLPKRFVGIGLFSDENRITVQARPVEEIRELAYVLLAAANYSEGQA